ncbi:sulfatase-like hydrolase/transferase [Polaribacter sp.]|uniref:sulfatase-like hydrolase/transferase n=1 Tax=Polaribacter sp. TaxID=1920175 RepID=UPI0040480A72
MKSIAQENNKPNIIIILTDDQGYGDVGFNGNKQLLTPNINRIANNGVVFKNGYVTYSVCGPSRAGLITGRYQDQFGFNRNPLFAPKDANIGLPLSEETLAEALKKAGYTNMAIGKWHLGAHESFRPLNRGFDEFFGFLSGGHKYFPEQLVLNDISEVKAQFDAYDTKILQNNTRIEEKEYLTDAFSREAVKFVEKSANKPFFLYLAYNAPHAPLQAPEKYLQRYKHIQKKDRQIYNAMVSAVDDGVGKLLDKLKELNIDKNTIVFFLSDNGGDLSKGSYNGNLRGGKSSLFEGGIRVPFAMQWPGTIPPKQVYENSIISLDIFATAVAQAKVIPKNKIDGVNLVPFLIGKKKDAPHESLYWKMFDKESFAIIKGDLKLVSIKKSTPLLFNLKKNSTERKSINDSIKVKKLKKLFDFWDAKNSKPIFDGLAEDKIYSEKHPDRYQNVEKY